jgi:hypothetical protein
LTTVAIRLPICRPLSLLKALGASLAFAWAAATVAGCQQGLGVFTTGVGSTPNRPPGAALRVLGQPGTQFTAAVSDSQSTWLIQGSIPLSVVLVNSTTPVKMVATKLAPGTGILSLQLTVGSAVSVVDSTSEPFGTATVQSDPANPGFSPPPPAANPDIRLFVKGPQGERFSGLVEDTERGFVINDRSPTLFLVENPVGKVDAVINQIQNLGPFEVDLIVSGAVVAQVTGGPTVSLRQP